MTEPSLPHFNQSIKIGILGGGQLGLMLIQSIMPYGAEVHVLDPDKEACCAPYCSVFTVGDFRDEETVFEFGKNLEVITIEIEHVNVEALKKLERLGVTIVPPPAQLELIQDKGRQKQFFLDHGFPTAPFTYLNSPAELAAHRTRLPAMLKSRREGYDGKGVALILPQEVEKWTANPFFAQSCILEELADIDKELSVLVARNEKGEIRVYDPVHMEMNTELNLVDFLLAPAGIAPEVALEAQNLSVRLIEALSLVGLLAVEMFLLTDGNLWINEIAPRPHNSGHHTIEACVTSQYDQLARILLKFPLGNSRTRLPSVLVNLLGSNKGSGPVQYQGLDAALALENCTFFLYGKQETRPNRKMGHFTVVDPDIRVAYQKAKRAKSLIQITPV